MVGSKSMCCEAQIARFWLLRRRVSQSVRAHSQTRRRVSTGVENESYRQFQGGKMFCASFCACFIAGSRRAFLCVDSCVDCVRQFVCLSLREFWLRLNEMHKVWTFAPRKAFLLLCGFCFSSLENYFGLGTTNVKGKTDHSVSLRWNKEFWTFPKRRVFFGLFIRFIWACTKT